MRSVERELIPGVVVVALGSAALITPDIVASYLSHDATLEPHTITELQLFRLLAAALGSALIAGLLVWYGGKQARWRQLIERDFAAWHDPIPRFNQVDNHFLRGSMACLCLATFGVVSTIAMSFEYFDSSWFALLAFENGIWETFQFLCFGLSGLALFAFRFRKWRGSRWTERAGGMLFALFLLVIAGEEVSWGQHWIGFSTPEMIGRINVQGETNLHNIGSYWIDHLSVFLMLNYLVVWPVLGYIYPQLHYVMNHFSLPVAPLGVSLVALLGLLMDEHQVLSQLWLNPLWRLSEGRETVFSACVLVSTLLLLRFPPDFRPGVRS
ncbi:MAG: hypothetical protein R8K46_02255 [Mariprofundaceae bacterium]